MKHIETLLIDENELISDIVKRILVRNEYDVTSCYNLSDAQEIIDEKSPKIIIVTMDTFERDINRFLKENKTRKTHGKYILISSSDNEVEMLKAGADDWMRKPYKIDVLLTRLEVLCRES